MISPANYSVDNIVFSEPQSSSIPDSSMTFKRINIQTRNEDGTLRDLVIWNLAALFLWRFRGTQS